jgi:hypothetical protein
MAKKQMLDLIDQSAPIVSYSFNSSDRSLTREERGIVAVSHKHVVAERAYYAKEAVAQQLHAAVEQNTVLTFTATAHAINAVAQVYQKTEVGGYVGEFAHRSINRLGAALEQTAQQAHTLINEEAGRSVYEKKRGWFE